MPFKIVDAHNSSFSPSKSLNKRDSGGSAGEKVFTTRKLPNMGKVGNDPIVTNVIKMHYQKLFFNISLCLLEQSNGYSWI